jgi:helicase
MRHKAHWIPLVKLLIVDEVHLLDSDRGPTLEALVARFRHLFPRVQVLALSATIPNAREIADWLDAQLVESSWRPTRLVKGVYTEPVLETTDGTRQLSSSEQVPIAQLVDDTISRGGCSLVFVNTRKSAAATAERLRPLVAKHSDKKALAELADKVENVLESPTRQCKQLAACVRSGVAFHTAGLVHEQRSLIEKAFKERVIKAICATPTLALGVNLPAETVIMAQMTRYTVNGVAPIPVREYLQCVGRAGRPQYGKDGLGVMVARDASEKEAFWQRYVLGEPEKVESQLGWEPVLRMQLLASVAMGFTPTRERLSEFLMHSFYAHQYGELASLMSKADRIIQELVGFGFVEVNDGLLSATPLGRRVSELYIDPLSAVKVLKTLRERHPQTAGLLYMLSNTEELRPHLKATPKEEAELWTQAYSREKELGIDAVLMGFEDYDFLDKYKTTLLLEAWIDERNEDGIEESFGIAPGILRSRLKNAEWICYGAFELAKATGLSEWLAPLERLRRRIKHGCKEELLPLVELRGIGRVRGRRLFNAGLKTAAGLKRAPSADLARVLGPAVAVSVKKQLGEEPQNVPGEAPQSSLSDYA